MRFARHKVWSLLQERKNKLAQQEEERTAKRRAKRQKKKVLMLTRLLLCASLFEAIPVSGYGPGGCIMCYVACVAFLAVLASQLICAQQKSDKGLPPAGVAQSLAAARTAKDSDDEGPADLD